MKAKPTPRRPLKPRKLREKPVVVAGEVESASITQLLTRYEVADALRISTHTLNSYVNQGRIKALRLGRNAIRFRQADVEQFIADSVRAVAG